MYTHVRSLGANDVADSRGPCPGARTVCRRLAGEDKSARSLIPLLLIFILASFR